MKQQMNKADNYKTRLSNLQAAFSFISYLDALMLTLLTSVFHLKCQILKINLSLLYTIPMFQKRPFCFVTQKN